MGNHFWTLDAEREICPDQPCQQYEFIGKRITKKLDYIKTWNVIRKFFEKRHHTYVPSYPVVCRWFPGLYFPVASVVAFQRMVGGKIVFELPYNPLIIPQNCLRFNDIPNVGVTGKHLTNFVMIGQHSITNSHKDKHAYWKDKCIELDFELLTKVFGLKPEHIIFLEDVWLGPNAFGYSLEYFSYGLELGNAVFTEFIGTPENYSHMGYKLIDMGAGLERFTWLTQGTPTCYDAIFGDVIKKLKKLIDYDKKLFEEYSRLAGQLNIDEVGDYNQAKKLIAKQMNVSLEELKKTTEPLEAIYAIADHTKTLLYAITDGALPSNVGGGYNLRVVLRRALEFVDKFDLNIKLIDVCELHAKYLKKFNSRLIKSLEEVEKIFDIEEQRFYSTRQKGQKIVETILERRIPLDNEKLTELYESHGITPEFISEIAEKKKLKIKIPHNFYEKISEKHMRASEEEKKQIDIGDIPPTKLLFYKNEKQTKFSAKVLKIINGKYVVLDKTCFYGRSGGQEPDLGTINGEKVIDVEKVGNIILHKMNNINFSEGDIIHAEIDYDRRKQLTQHHTAIHIINGAARKVLGKHVWQAGAHKDVNKAHLDITHYQTLTEKEIDSIERIANNIVKKHIRIKKTLMPRKKAESKYGIRIYQGGAVPEKNLRIVEIPNHDIEACGGLHCDNTSQVERILILSTERIQDGIVRITIAAGKAAEKYLEQQKDLFKEIEKITNTKGKNVINAVEKIIAEWKRMKKTLEKKRKQHAAEIVKKIKERYQNKRIIIEKFENKNLKDLQILSKEMSNEYTVIILFGIEENRINIFISTGEKTTEHAGEIMKEICQRLGGKGGGTKLIAQGIGFNKDKLHETIEYLQEKLV